MVTYAMGFGIGTVLASHKSPWPAMSVWRVEATIETYESEESSKSPEAQQLTAHSSQCRLCCPRLCWCSGCVAVCSVVAIINDVSVFILSSSSLAAPRGVASYRLPY